MSLHNRIGAVVQFPGVFSSTFSTNREINFLSPPKCLEMKERDITNLSREIVDNVVNETVPGHVLVFHLKGLS
jgi:hypothetical protein